MQRANSSVFVSLLLSSKFIPACFICYVGVRLAVISLVPIDQFSDNLWYFSRAVALAAGQGYSEDGIPTAYWPPGWPGVLGLVFWVLGPSPWVGQIANLMFAAITFWIACRLGSILFANAMVGRLTVLSLALYPNQIGYVAVLGTEVFYTALLLLAIAVTIGGQKWSRLVLSGFLFGIATLTKAQSFFIPLTLFTVWWLAARDRPKVFQQIGRVALLYAAMMLVILPWSVRNYAVFGEFVSISTNGGWTLLSGNNPSAWGDYTEDDALVRSVPNGVVGQVANDRLATALAFKWIHANPGKFLALIPKKIWRLWAPDGEAEWSYQAGFKHYQRYAVIFRLVRGINQLYYVCLMILFAASCLYFLHSRDKVSPYAITGYVLAAYFTGISIVFSGQSRFHYPLMPWIAMYAAWTIVQWVQRRKAVEDSAAATSV
jgi:hypothetical protein